MKIIFIRGVPGTGKTTIAKILGKIIPNSQVIYVDEFKIKEMKKGRSFEESQKIAYEKTFKRLHLLHKQKKNYIILEELICEKDFLNGLIEFLNKTKSYSYWFRLLRPLDKLLKIESYRTRKLKNTKGDLFKLKQDIESLKIKNEYLIKNDNLALTIKKILNVVC